MKYWFKSLSKNLIVLALGIVLTYAFAPYYVFVLAIIALAGLLAALLNTSPARAFWLGFIFGIGFFGAGVYWVFNSIHDIGGVPVLLASVITAGMIVILALYPAIVCYLTQRFFPSPTTAKLILAFHGYSWAIAKQTLP